MYSYKAKGGQSIYDVCLQTYGDLKYLFKLMLDNGISNLNQSDVANIVFIFDPNLIVDVSIYNSNFNQNTFYYSSAQSNKLQTDGGEDLETDGGDKLIID